MSMALDFLFTRHREHCHGILPSLQQAITIRMRAVPFNIRVVRAHSPTSDFDDDEKEKNHDQQQNAIDQTPKKDILVVQGDRNSKVGRDACRNWQGISSAITTQWTLLQ